MKKSIKIVGNYKVETYKINEGLSFSMAFDKNLDKPANGGLRFCQYANQASQEEEALILATHMTQKHEIYSTGFTGVKLVANGVVNKNNKRALLQAVAKVLNKKHGQIYTGCDMNINNDDMRYLQTMSPYMLNAMIAPQIDTSTATAWGVYGSLQAVIESHDATEKSLRLLINGVGKIGSVLADKLIQLGHTVFTYDIDASRAEIPGAVNLSDRADWASTPCDYLLLCSSSNIINEENVNQLNCRWIISSANSPFSSQSVVKVLEEKNIHWIPDVVSNAGAVLCDSIEYYSPQLYASLPSKKIYGCVERCIYKKTSELLMVSNQYQLLPSDALDVFLTMKRNGVLIPDAA